MFSIRIVCAYFGQLGLACMQTIVSLQKKTNFKMLHVELRNELF